METQIVIIEQWSKAIPIIIVIGLLIITLVVDLLVTKKIEYKQKIIRIFKATEKINGTWYQNPNQLQYYKWSKHTNKIKLWK